ncbi:MAG: M20 family metallopeptidase [Bacillota bacterium]|nr:M20 family metallopeptidase [Bacillota bacterium]
MKDEKETTGYIGAARALQDDIVSWRRDLHRIPELGFDLHQTSAYVRSRLEEMGVSYRIAAETGIVALIEGTGRGPTLALRSDMDALPIREETGLPFASTNNNMHACGHDAHAAMLLGTAKILLDYRSRMQGNVKLFFQPGEEGYGGAARMIAHGCLEDPPVDAVVGLHVGQIFPEVGLGQIGICAGPILAASTAFEVLIKGSSTHGALPHLGVDAITTSAEIILALQKIVSRETNPLNPVVLTIGKIKGGEAMNIITDKVSFSGDFRTMEGSDRDFVTVRLQEICTATAAANRAVAEVKILGGYPPTVNDPEYVKRVVSAASRVVGRDNIIMVKKPNMGTEDMAYYFEKVPGAYFVLGTGNPARGIVYPHHNSRFDIDESVLWMGPAIFAGLALDYLGPVNQ